MAMSYETMGFAVTGMLGACSMIADCVMISAYICFSELRNAVSFKLLTILSIIDLATTTFELVTRPLAASSVFWCLANNIGIYYWLTLTYPYILYLAADLYTDLVIAKARQKKNLRWVHHVVAVLSCLLLTVFYTLMVQDKAMLVVEYGNPRCVVTRSPTTTLMYLVPALVTFALVSISMVTILKSIASLRTGRKFVGYKNIAILATFMGLYRLPSYIWIFVVSAAQLPLSPTVSLLGSCFRLALVSQGLVICIVQGRTRRFRSKWEEKYPWTKHICHFCCLWKSSINETTRSSKNSATGGGVSFRSAPTHAPSSSGRHDSDSFHPQPARQSQAGAITLEHMQSGLGEAPQLTNTVLVLDDEDSDDEECGRVVNFEEDK